jgi:hypothetical protein
LKALKNNGQALLRKKKATDKKILFKDLNENQKLSTSVNERKFFLDTIKIIAYRAEKALCNIQVCTPFCQFVDENDLGEPEQIVGYPLISGGGYRNLATKVHDSGKVYLKVGESDI